MLDRLNSDKVIPKATHNDISSVKGDPDYQKASNLVMKLQLLLEGRQGDHDKYLNQICDSLVEIEYTAAIARKMKKELGYEISSSYRTSEGMFYIFILTTQLFGIATHNEKLDRPKLQNIVETLEKCHFPKANWEAFGLKLGLYYTTLDEIEKECRGSPDGCFRKCLSKWLEEKDGVKDNGGATWESLVKAIRKMDNNALAEAIEKEL